MSRWVAPVVAVLSVVGVLGGLALATSHLTSPVPDVAPRAGDPPLSSPGSSCPAPLGWRLAAVDPRFEVPVDEVEGAVEAAVRVWNEGAHRLLLVPDPGDGVAIRLVHDSRQERLRESQRTSGELEQQESALAEGRRELAVLQAAHEREVRTLEQAAAIHASARDRHNTEVRRWNEAGGAPDSMVPPLRSREERLRSEAHQLDLERRRLEAQAEGNRASATELSRLADAFERGREDAASRLPPTEVEAAVYREWSLGWAGEPGRIGREIRVFRFADRNDLVQILAHEFGHALGLPHLTTPGAIMNDRGGVGGWYGEPTLHANDLTLLQTVCPDA